MSELNELTAGAKDTLASARKDQQNAAEEARKTAQSKLKKAESSAQTVFENARNDAQQQLAQVRSDAQRARSAVQSERDEQRRASERARTEAADTVNQARALFGGDSTTESSSGSDSSGGSASVRSPLGNQGSGGSSGGSGSTASSLLRKVQQEREGILAEAERERTVRSDPFDDRLALACVDERLILLAALAATGRGVGHHYFPVQLIVEYWKYLTPAAREVANGYTSGSGPKPHRGRHTNEYLDAIREKFEQRFARKIANNQKITAREMFAFIRDELHHADKASEIGQFHESMGSAVARGVGAPKTIAEARRLGKATMRRAKAMYLRKRLLALKRYAERVRAEGRLPKGLLAQFGGMAVNQAILFLQVSAGNRHLRNAIAALSDPDDPQAVYKAYQELLGPNGQDCLVTDIGAKGAAGLAQLAAKQYLEQIFASLDE